MRTFTLPPKTHLYKTDEDDPVFLHFLPGIGYVYKKRLKNTLSLLGDGPYEQLLEIGYGSGILFPELSKRARCVTGVEIHDKEAYVYKTVHHENITNVVLKKGTIYALPFAQSSFDRVVSVSTLEHLDNLNKALLEIQRVLKPSGKAVLSFPVRNPITDTFFRIVGYNPRHLHPSSHNDILNAVHNYFYIERYCTFPPFLPIDYSLYCTIRVGRK